MHAPCDQQRYRGSAAQVMGLLSTGTKTAVVCLRVANHRRTKVWLEVWQRHPVSELVMAESPQMQVLNLPSSHFRSFAAAVDGGGAMVGLVRTLTSTWAQNIAVARTVEVVGSQMQSVSGFHVRSS